MNNSFIICAEDRIILDMQIKKIKQDLNLDVEADYYDVKENGMAEILGVLNTPTFLSDNKLVIIKDSENIANLSERDYNYLIKYLANPAPFSYLILWFNKEDNKVIPNLRKYAIYYDLNARRESIDKFIKAYLDDEGFKYNDEVISFIASYGDDLTKISNILAEVVCYKYDEKEVAVSDVLELLSLPIEDNVYELCTAVIKRDVVKAYNIYTDLLKNNVSITYLLGLIINKFQEIYNNNILVNFGYNQNDIAEVNNVKIGRAYYMLQEAKNVSNKSLRRTLTKLNDIEYGIKKGSLNPKVAFSSYLLGL